MCRKKQGRQSGQEVKPSAGAGGQLMEYLVYLTLGQTKRLAHLAHEWVLIGILLANACQFE